MDFRRDAKAPEDKAKAILMRWWRGEKTAIVGRMVGFIRFSTCARIFGTLHNREPLL